LTETAARFVVSPVLFHEYSGDGYFLNLLPNKIESMARTRKTTNRIFAMPTALEAIPPNPSMAAIMAIIKKTIA